MNYKILIGVAIFGFMLVALSGVSHASSPAYSEINVEIYGLDASYGLNITGAQNTSIPMINDFSFIMHSPGNSTYTVDLGNKTIASGTFAYVGVAHLNTSYNGTVVLTVYITSSTLSHTSSFTYILNIMTPVTYINYEQAKTKPPGTLPYVLLGEGIAASGLAVYVYRVILRHLVVKPRQDAIDDSSGIIRSG